MSLSVEQLYGELWGRAEPGFDERVRASLNPRGADVLYERFGEFVPGPESRVLDVGCRSADHGVELVKRFGCRVIGIDPLPLHLELARQRVAEAGMEERVALAAGRIEALPLAGGSVDHVWCRDMLNHVDLPRGLAECFRVLRPGGGMLVYQTFATQECEPREAMRLYSALAIRPENMARAYFEATARAAGFALTLTDPIDSEWRERWMEEGNPGPADALLHLARMRRREAELVRDYGRERYEAAYATDLWGVYQFLGKLCPTVYVLRRPDCQKAEGSRQWTEGRRRTEDGRRQHCLLPSAF
jgi:SAM-dependent methyltransferase